MGRLDKAMLVKLKRRTTILLNEWDCYVTAEINFQYKQLRWVTGMKKNTAMQ